MRTDWDLSVVRETDREAPVRLWIEDADDEFVDVSDFFESGRVSTLIDQPATSASFTLLRDPEITPLVDLSELIAPFRRILFEVAVKSRGDVSAPTYRPLFMGKLGDYGWGGDEDQIVLPCWDLWGVIQRKQISIVNPATYGSTSGVAMETVMQQILTAQFGGAITLRTLGTPDRLIKAFEQGAMPTGDALMAVAATKGWQVRYLWNNDDEEFQPTLYTVDRSKTVPDYTFATHQKMSVPDIRMNVSGIRNQGIHRWSETAAAVITDDSASQIELGETIAIQFDSVGDSQFASEADAIAFSAPIVHDLAVPAVSKTARMRLFPGAELGDLYSFPGDGVHHTGSLDLAVVGITHEFYPAGQGQPKTELQLAGKVKGGHDRWISISRQMQRTQKLVGNTGGLSEGTYAISQPPTILSVTPVPNANAMDLRISANTASLSLRYYVDDEGTSDADMLAGLTAATPIEGNGAYVSNAATVIAEGETRLIWAASYPFAAGGGVAGSIYKTQYTRPVESAAKAGLSANIDFEADGDILPSLIGNETSASWRYVVLKDSPPTDAAVRAATPIDGVSLLPAALGTPGTAAAGELWYIGAFSYSLPNGAGTEGPRLTNYKRFGVTAAGVPASTITNAMLTEQGRSFSFTGDITTATTNKFGWTTGILRVGSASHTITAQTANQSIGAGGKQFIYWDPAVSTTTFQHTNLEANVVGDRKIPIGIIFETSNGGAPGVIATVGALAVADVNIQADSVAANHIQANAITTVKLDALSVTAAKIAAGTITADKLSVTTLSAITANLGTVTAGSISGVTGSFAGDLTATVFSSNAGRFEGTGWNILAEDDVTLIGAKSIVLVGSGFSGEIAALTWDDTTLLIEARTAAGPPINYADIEMRCENLTLKPDEGSGDSGFLIIENLPTADPGGTDRVWRDSGVLKIT